MITSMGVVRVINILLQAAIVGGDLYLAIQNTRALMDKMLAEKRDPTEEELSEVMDRIKDRSKRIQGA